MSTKLNTIIISEDENVLIQRAYFEREAVRSLVHKGVSNEVIFEILHEKESAYEKTYTDLLQKYFKVSPAETEKWEIKFDTKEFEVTLKK